MRKKLPLILVNMGIVGIITAITLFNLHSKLIIGGDNRAFFFFPEVYLLKNYYVWNEINGIGSFFVGSQDLPLYIMQFLLAKISPSAQFLHDVNYVLFNVLIFYSAVYFIKQFVKRYLKSSPSFFYLAMGALFYVFNLSLLHALYDGQAIQIIPFFLIPFGLGFFINYLETKKISSLLPVFLLIFIGNNLAHILVFLITLMGFIIFDYYRFHEKALIKRYLIFLLTFFLSIAFIVVSNLSYFNNSYGEIKGNTYIQKSTIDSEFGSQRDNLSLSTSMRNLLNPGIFFLPNYRPINSDNPLLFIPVILFTSFLFLNIRRKQRTYLYFFGAYLLSIFVLKGFAAPLGLIFKFMIEEVPGMVMFRSIHFKWNYIYLIIQTSLFVLCLMELKRYFHSEKVRKWVVAALTLLLILPCFGFISNLYNKNVMVDLPDSYLESVGNFNKIAKENGLERGFVLPDTKNQWATQTAFGFWGYSFFSQSNYEIGFIDQGTATTSSINADIYNRISTQIKNESYSDLNTTMKQYGINFFVVQKDFAYNFQDIKVANQEKIIANFVADCTNRGVARSIYDDQHIQVYQLFEVNLPRVAVTGGKVDYERISPVHYKVFIDSDVDDVTTLVLNESFNSNWQIYRKNSSLLGLFYNPLSFKHNKTANGTNAWEIRQEDVSKNRGNFELYFRPQNYINAGIFVFCLVLALYLTLSIIEQRRIRK